MPSNDLWLISGCPGGGKTTSLAHQAKRAADTHGPQSVAIASLTRTAANEIAGRDTGIPDEHVGTLHAHCYRALDRPELAETPEGLALWNEAHPDRKIGAGTGLDDAPTEQYASEDLHAQVNALRAQMADPGTWTEGQRDHHAAWTDFKRETGRLDFTDLIERAISDVPEHPAAPTVLLGDEAQDFSALELTLFQSWARHAQTAVLSADLDQCLYSWRGADAAKLAALDYAGVRHLSESYRVPESICDVARGWIADTENPHRANYHGTNVAGHVRQSPHSLRYPEAIVPEIEADLDDGSSVMILTTCGYMLTPMLHALRAQGVPYHNPYRPTQGAWNPLRAASRLLAYLRPDERVWGTRARAWTWADLHDWTEPLAAASALARGAKTLIAAKCRPDQFGESQAQREVELETVVELLGATDLAHPALHLDVDWWASQLRASRRKAMSYPLEICARRGGAALRETPRLTVGTVHSVKGGEADHVTIFPNLSRSGMWHGWHPGGDGRAAIVRMGYVALTRARESVTVMAPAGPEYMPLPDALRARTVAA